MDRLVYFHDTDAAVTETAHAFIYFLSVRNLSDRTVTLTGRRWVMRSANGATQVIEGNGIVGKQPTLAPGEVFSYNSHHAVSMDSTAEGSFHGVDSDGRAIHVRIPRFEMTLPAEQSGPPHHEVD